MSEMLDDIFTKVSQSSRVFDCVLEKEKKEIEGCMKFGPLWKSFPVVFVYSSLAFAPPGATDLTANSFLNRVYSQRTSPF